MNDLPTAIENLIQNGSKKSINARLRLFFDDIERAFESGVKRESVLEALNANGFDLNISTFNTYIYRLRKERKAGNRAKPQSFTQSRDVEPEELKNLTQQERRERKANQFIKPEFTNPLLKNLHLKAN